MRIILVIPFMVSFSFASFAECNIQIDHADTLIETFTIQGKNKKQKGDTLVFYEVLQLKDLNFNNKIMVVYVQSIVETRRSKSKLHARYLLKRERQYLEKIFFTKVRVLESKSTEQEPLKSFAELSEKYNGINLWTILNANQFFSKIHSR
jgi:hypothetical protein